MPGGEGRLYLADKSALEQRRHSEDARNLLALLLGDGALATCHVLHSKSSTRRAISLTTRPFERTSVRFRGFRHGRRHRPRLQCSTVSLSAVSIACRFPI